MKRIAIAFGTRPEQIKLAPVAQALFDAEVLVWCSGQSRDLVSVVQHGMRNACWTRGLASGIANCIDEFSHWLEREKPDAVIVQGDTATAFACAQAAFLARVPIAHVEAGLRTYADEPWPEEAFRRQIAAVARWHFCPDNDAAANIWRENAPEHVESGFDGVHIVGNTVIDTLPRKPFRVLVTLHRRENWGSRIQGALDALDRWRRAAGDAGANVELLIVRHPNWSAQGVGTSAPTMAPLERNHLLEHLRRCDAVVTDSGGLQEEAAHFGKSCAVIRTSTERVALERAGAVTLLSPDDPAELEQWLEQELRKRRCYGNGTAGMRIAEILMRELADA